MARKEKTTSISTGKKEVTLIVCAVIVIAVAVVVCVNSFKGIDKKPNSDNKLKDEVVEVANTNPGVVEDKEQDGLKFTNTILMTSEKNSTLTVLVTNMTDKDIDVRVFDIYVKDKDGNLITKLQGYVGEVVPVGTSREIESSVTLDLSEATSIEYKLVN